MRQRMWWGVAAVLAVVAGLLAPRALGGDCADAEATEVVAAFSRDLLSYDAASVEDQVSRVLAYGDERFVEEYRAAAGPEFVANVQANGTRAEARILSGPTLDGCVDGDPAFGVLLSQVVQRDADAAPRTLRTPLRVTLTEDDDTWRVHEVDIL